MGWGLDSVGGGAVGTLGWGRGRALDPQEPEPQKGVWDLNCKVTCHPRGRQRCQLSLSSFPSSRWVGQLATQPSIFQSLICPLHVGTHGGLAFSGPREAP